MLLSTERFLLVEYRSQQVKPDIVLLYLTVLELFPFSLQTAALLIGNGKAFPSYKTFSFPALLVVEIMSHFEERGRIKSYTLHEFRHLFSVCSCRGVEGLPPASGARLC